MSSFQKLRSNVDLSQLPAVGQRQLIELVNRFVSSHSQNLEELAIAVDNRLCSIEKRMDTCSSNLLLLESKLNSLPSELRQKIINDYKQKHDSPSAIESEEPKESIEIDQTMKIDSEQSEQSNVDQSTESNQVEPEEVNTINVEVSDEDQQALMKYRRMASVGVPLPAIHQKMRLEGLDPSLL